MQLSSDALANARAAIFKDGRRLEQCRFMHHFEEPDAELVATELARFQNPDGGFGHGIEPDFWLPESSALATTVGLQIAVELELAASHPIVRAALDYLRESYDQEIDGWQATPITVNDYPHAPWWHRDPAASPDENALRLNPSAEIAGYFLRWGENDWQDWVHNLVQSIDNLEAHQLLCCLRLADSPNLATDTRDKLCELIARIAPGVIESDPGKWNDYCVKPLSAIHTPDSWLASSFADAIALQLDDEISRQAAGTGAWVPHWSWAGNYPDAWEEARRQWSGIITLEMLRTMQAFGRLGS